MTPELRLALGIAGAVVTGTACALYGVLREFSRGRTGWPG